jgi:type IV pilus assembly protein PilY1
MANGPNGKGQWAAVFGNGYNNTGTGRAMLYIVDIATGNLIQKIDTGVNGGGGTPANPNGMSTPAVVDLNGDHIADYIYAGDLLGKMWRIDVRSSTAANWSLAANVHPLFTAVDTLNVPQPITTKPSVGFHPEGFGGLLVYFGTGKFLENFDNSATGVQQRQTFYAIYDRGVTGRSAEPSRTEPTPIVRADLRQQTIETTTGTVGSFSTRNISDDPINWRLDRASTTTHLGWYVDLPESGEKQVTDSLLREGRIIFTTLSPGTDACEPGGTGWLMELNSKNGGRLDETLDLNGDGVFDSNDNNLNPYGAAGAQVAGGGSLSSPIVLTNPPSLPPPAGPQYSETKLVVTSKGAVVTMKESGKPNAPEAWRQVR